MSSRNDEDLLREAFQDLKRDARRRGTLPEFEAMMSRAHAVSADGEIEPTAGPRGSARASARAGRRTWAHPGGWLALATAAAVAGLILTNASSSRADREFERLVASYSSDMGAGAWQSPTDALLRTPGIDLGAVPSVGGYLREAGSRPGADDIGRDS